MYTASFCSWHQFRLDFVSVRLKTDLCPCDQAGLQMRLEETVSRYGGMLRIYWINSRGQSRGGVLLALGLGDGLTVVILIKCKHKYNIEGRSRYNGCHGKEIGIKYSECVSVFLP